MKSFKKTKGICFDKTTLHITEMDIEVITRMRIWNVTFKRALRELGITVEEFMNQTKLNSSAWVIERIKDEN